MKTLTIIAAQAVVSVLAYAQFLPANQNLIQGGAGITWIDNQRFYAFRLRPEFAFSNIGVGLDLNLEFDSTGALRKENFNEFSDYASIIRYVRYGTERDTFFAKLGALDYTTIGHGSIISNYNNSPSFDARRIGLQLNVNFGKVGLQTMYGSFGEAGVVGVRGYVKPLQYTSLADLPVIGNLEVGATYAADYSKYARIDSITLANPLQVFTAGSLNIIGADIGLPIVRGDVAGLELYADYAKIIDYGDGFATGALFSVDGIPLLNVKARIERRFNGEQYLPSYFNSFYEIERFNLVNLSAKSLILKNATIYSNGTYGDLLIRFINTFDVYGSYQKLDKVNESGIFHMFTEISPAEAPVIARAGYDKSNIKDLSDLITTDERSFLYAEFGYKPYPYLVVSIIYMWTYAPVRDGDEIVGFEPQRRVEPKVSFVYTF